jgi:hypothetical protein
LHTTHQVILQVVLSSMVTSQAIIHEEDKSPTIKIYNHFSKNR